MTGTRRLRPRGSRAAGTRVCATAREAAGGRGGGRGPELGAATGADPGSRRGGPRGGCSGGGRQLLSRAGTGGAAPGLRPPRERCPRRAPTRPPAGVTAAAPAESPSAPSVLRGAHGDRSVPAACSSPAFPAPRPAGARVHCPGPEGAVVPVEALGRPRSARASAGNRPSGHPCPPADAEEPLRNSPPPAGAARALFPLQAGRPLPGP